MERVERSHIMIASFAKRYKIILAAILAPIFICIVCLSLVSCTPQDIKYDEAIRIAKKDFGCEKILWIEDNALILSTGEPTVVKMRSHYSFYVVGEKDGEEIYIVIPSTPELDEPYIATWALDYSFAQIVEKFNEYGAKYVADVPDDFYSTSFNDYIDLVVAEFMIKILADNYEVGADGDAFYERLDVKAAFYYRWQEDGFDHNCIVTQENGELKAYERVNAI